MLSCLSTLFGVAEFEIQEDFLQISELVYTEKISVNRSTSLEPKKSFIFNKLLLPKYHGSPALYSEEIFASGLSVLGIYQFLKNYRLDINSSDELDFWILGDNYNDTSRIDAEDGVNCGEMSCYEKSVENGKICKSGRFCLLQSLKFKLKNDCIS